MNLYFLELLGQGKYRIISVGGLWAEQLTKLKVGGIPPHRVL